MPDSVTSSTFAQLGHSLLIFAPDRLRRENDRGQGLAMPTQGEQARYLFGQLENLARWYGLKVNVGGPHVGAVVKGDLAAATVGGLLYYVGAISMPAIGLVALLGALIGQGNEALPERLGMWETRGKNPEQAILMTGVGGCAEWANAIEQMLRANGLKPEIVMMAGEGVTPDRDLQNHTVTQTACLLE